jgi:hypothetical protein
MTVDQVMNEKQIRFISIAGWLHYFGKIYDTKLIQHIELYVSYEFETPFNKMHIESYFKSMIRG